MAGLGPNVSDHTSSRPVFLVRVLISLTLLYVRWLSMRISYSEWVGKLAILFRTSECSGHSTSLPQMAKSAIYLYIQLFQRYSWNFQ